jgi:hypothetical protein
MPPKRSSSPAHRQAPKSPAAKTKSLPKTASSSVSSATGIGRHGTVLPKLEVKGTGVAAPPTGAAAAASEAMPGSIFLDRQASDDPTLSAVQAMPDDGIRQAVARLPDPNKDPNAYAGTPSHPLLVHLFCLW